MEERVIKIIIKPFASTLPKLCQRSCKIRIRIEFYNFSPTRRHNKNSAQEKNSKTIRIKRYVYFDSFLVPRQIKKA